MKLPQQIFPAMAISIKPHIQFLKNLDQLIKAIIQKTKVYQLAIVGAEMNALEIALAIHHRILKELSKNVKALESFQIAIYTNKNKILSQLNCKAGNILFAFKGNDILENFRTPFVTAVNEV